ncbi:hypothetical protein ACF07B_42725 [Streptomyces sp. NPDC015532]|uniref:hypothetical protein n=1 Tax=Streptomyces sp. NPDC015532 TaxID=3364960 RepID=UPI0037026E23
MTVHPFIEAEKRDGHNVKRACELLKVSRAAFYARCKGTPGPRAVRDAELLTVCGHWGRIGSKFRRPR